MKKIFLVPGEKQEGEQKKKKIRTCLYGAYILKKSVLKRINYTLMTCQWF